MLHCVTFQKWLPFLPFQAQVLKRMATDQYKDRLEFSKRVKQCCLELQKQVLPNDPEHYALWTVCLTNRLILDRKFID
jgi:hypothetical protein